MLATQMCIVTILLYNTISSNIETAVFKRDVDNVIQSHYFSMMTSADNC